MRRIIALICAVICLSGILCSCSKKIGEVSGEAVDNGPEITTRDPNEVKTVMGEGDNQFIFEITDEEGGTSSYIIRTNQSTVGNALQEWGLATFEETKKGEKITISGKEISKRAEWKFYVNGRPASYVPTKTQIENMKIYSFVYEK